VMARSTQLVNIAPCWSKNGHITIFFSHYCSVHCTVPILGSHLRTPNPGFNPGFASPAFVIWRGLNPGSNPGFDVLRSGLGYWYSQSEAVVLVNEKSLLFGFKVCLGSATRYTTHLSSTVLTTVLCDPLLLW
jgi:hypothetical protein